jgi:hypothetical protein
MLYGSVPDVVGPFFIESKVQWNGDFGNFFMTVWEIPILNATRLPTSEITLHPKSRIPKPIRLFSRILNLERADLWAGKRWNCQDHGASMHR